MNEKQNGNAMPALNHANIQTAKLQETITFFENAVGLTLGPRPDFGFPGAWLYAGDQAIVHLVQRPKAIDPDGALDHISFTVDDLDAKIARLRELGIPCRQFDIPNGFGRQAFTKDPNGITIEFTEPGPGPQA